MESSEEEGGSQRNSSWQQEAKNKDKNDGNTDYDYDYDFMDVSSSRSITHPLIFLVMKKAFTPNSILLCNQTQP